jgi:hypothetical protein
MAKISVMVRRVPSMRNDDGDASGGELVWCGGEIITRRRWATVIVG